MKRINRYAALRIPKELDYEHSVITVKQLKKTRISKRRRINDEKTVKNQKLSVICYVKNGKLIISCPVCHSVLNKNQVGCERYRNCKICDCKYDLESKQALKYYYKYLPETYKKIDERRTKNRADRYRLKAKHQEEEKTQYYKQLYPQITVWNENGKEEIITNITKELRESDDLTQNEKLALIHLQIPLEKYKILKTLDIKTISYITDPIDENFMKRFSESVNNNMKECNNREKGD